jgi:hypothetical protein
MHASKVVLHALVGWWHGGLTTSAPKALTALSQACRNTKVNQERFQRQLHDINDRGVLPTGINQVFGSLGACFSYCRRSCLD